MSESFETVGHVLLMVFGYLYVLVKLFVTLFLVAGLTVVGIGLGLWESLSLFWTDDSHPWIKR